MSSDPIIYSCYWIPHLVTLKLQDILINEGEGKVDFFYFNIFININLFSFFLLILFIVDNICTNQNIFWSPESVGDKKIIFVFVFANTIPNICICILPFLALVFLYLYFHFLFKPYIFAILFDFLVNTIIFNAYLSKKY